MEKEEQFEKKGESLETKKNGECFETKGEYLEVEKEEGRTGRIENDDSILCNKGVYCINKASREDLMMPCEWLEKKEKDEGRWLEKKKKTTGGRQQTNVHVSYTFGKARLCLYFGSSGLHGVVDQRPKNKTTLSF